MTTWRLFGRAAFGAPWLTTLELPDGIAATAARAAAVVAAERDPRRPSLIGMRLVADGAPWINVGQMRGKECAEIVAAILGAAIVRRPDWLINCHQDGQWRPWGAPFNAEAHPLPIASHGQTRAQVRFAASTGQRWAKAGAR